MRYPRRFNRTVTVTIVVLPLVTHVCACCAAVKFISFMLELAAYVRTRNLPQCYCHSDLLPTSYMPFPSVGPLLLLATAPAVFL